jgi:hypothetical protein
MKQMSIIDITSICSNPKQTRQIKIKILRLEQLLSKDKKTTDKPVESVIRPWGGRLGVTVHKSKACGRQFTPLLLK